MPVTTSYYATAHGSKYLQQLSKHFAHKVEVTYDANTSQVVLEASQIFMNADADGLSFRITADDAKAMIHARFVIDSHLVTFAHREAFMGLTWQLESDAG